MSKNKSDKNGILFQNKSLLSTFILLLSVAVISFILVLRIEALTRDQCYKILSSSTKEAGNMIENNFSNDRNSLRILSRVIALEDDLTSGEVNEILTTYSVSSLISNIAIITPENTIVQIRGGNIENNSVLDFSHEASLGEHVSGLQQAINSSGNKVMRNYVPIKKSGKIIGILFLEMNPTEISGAWSPEIYDNSASFCVIDRTTGDLLINSYDKSIGNLSELASDELAENIRSGKTGFMQMRSSADKEDHFVSYMPMDMENWEIMVAVPESAVFSSANAIRSSLRVFLAVVAVSLILYLIWIMYSARRSIAATEKQANIDVLTGLQNRNRYEAFCRGLDKRLEDVGCIYIDANGLHEINNSRGHLAGDQMLRFIADTLKVTFGEETVYRIGGDEFVVFCREKSESELDSDMSRVHEEIERNDYHISSGICMSDEAESVDEMIKTAEKRMYELKRKYYESIGRQLRNGPGS